MQLGKAVLLCRRERDFAIQWNLSIIVDILKPEFWDDFCCNVFFFQEYKCIEVDLLVPKSFIYYRDFSHRVLKFRVC